MSSSSGDESEQELHDEALIEAERARRLRADREELARLEDEMRRAMARTEAARARTIALRQRYFQMRRLNERLNESTKCKMCRNRLASTGDLRPFILTGCGHSFCLACCYETVETVLHENPDATKAPCPQCSTEATIETVEGRKTIGVPNHCVIQSLADTGR